MTTDTQLDYDERIALVKRYIREHLDEPINRDDLARLCVAIYPDEVEEGKSACFDAGAIFTPGTEPAAGDGLAYQTLPAGRWAVFQHVGPYDTLWQTWQAAYRDWLPTAGYELRDAVPFEDYVDDPSQIAPEKLRTEIFIPIQ